MAQISVDTFYRESVTLVVDIENVLAWIDYLPVGGVAVCTILPGIRCMVYYALDRLTRFVSTYNMTDDLTRNTTDHRYNIDVLPCFCMGFEFYKPIQFVQLYRSVSSLCLSFSGRCGGSFFPVSFFIQFMTLDLFIPRIFPTPRPLTPP